MTELSSLQSQVRILIVEDENIVALDLERGLRRLGYSVVGMASTGQEAIRMAEETRPDLILMDIQLKGAMDGITAAKQIRELFNVPVVFLTAYSDEGTLQRAKTSEAFGYLLKPFEEIELRTTIETVLNKDRMIRLKDQASATQLKRSKEIFEILVESITDYGIFMLDPEGVVVSWNKGAERLYGWSAEEIVGTTSSAFSPIADLENAPQPNLLYIAATKGRSEQEGLHLHRNGAAFWANVIVVPLKDELGKLRGFAGVTQNLTERKNAENALRLANESLEKRVQDRTADLREALKTRDEFLSIASHELKTPLTALSLQLQILKRAVVAQNPGIEAGDERAINIHSPAALIKLASDSEVQSGKLNALLDELLDLTRIRIGRFQLHKETVDICALTRSVVESKNAELAHDGIAISVKAESTIVGCWDSIRIEQVVGNLLSNAIKYGDKKPIEVSVVLDSETGCVNLSVLDHGKGIAPEMRSQVFKRFERANAAKGIPGLGLGLYIVHQIVAAHGGSISVASNLGTGSTFTVALPLNASEEAGLRTDLKVGAQQPAKTRAG